MGPSIDFKNRSKSSLLSNFQKQYLLSLIILKHVETADHDGREK